MQNGCVIPLLLDLDFQEVSGPLSQFQAIKADNTGIKELIVRLNKTAPAPVLDAQLEKLYTALWGDLEKQITSIPNRSASAKHARPQGEILEELVSSVRNVEMRVRDVMDDDPSIRNRRRMRYHPQAMHMLMHRVADGPSDPVQLLFLAGLLRDDVPWLYELALEAYRSVKAGRKEEAYKALRRFRDTLDALQRSPFLELIGVDKYSMRMIRSDIFPMLDFIDFTGVDAEEAAAKSEES